MLTWQRCADVHRRACTATLVLADELYATESPAPQSVDEHGNPTGVREWYRHDVIARRASELQDAAYRHAHIAERAHERELQARERVELLVLEDLAGFDSKGRW
jgi:hypothetical protein